MPLLFTKKGEIKMVDRKQLKEKYGDEKVFVVPVSVVQHINDKFEYSKHDAAIWKKYDSLGTYVPRHEAEFEPAMQQIIPYFIIFNEDETKLYLSRRLQGDHRLTDKLSLGFGGHINEEDGYNQCVLKALTREMYEELDIDPITKATYMGTIRDITSSTNDHFGLVFATKAREGEVAIKETDKLEGLWMTLEEVYQNYPKFENWSKYIIDFLYENFKK